MGGNQSVSVASQVTTNVTNVIVSSLQQCAGSLAQNQNVTVGGTGNSVSNVNQNQSASLSMSCLSTGQTLTNLQSQITNSIMQQLSQSDVAGLSALGDDTAKQTTTVQNEVVANFTQSNIQKCFIALTQNQGVTVNGTGNAVANVSQTQALTASMNCVGNIINSMTATSAAINSAQQSLTQTEANPLDALTNIFSSITDAIMAIVGVIVFVIIMLIFLMFSGGSSKKEQPQIVYMPPPGYGPPPPPR